MIVKSDTALVSVVIPARDVQDYIGDTIASLKAQTEGAFECVVLDDGSRDGTAAVVAEAIREDSRFALRQAPGQGVSAARNLGAGLTRAPYLLFLDADDLLAADALRRMIDALSGPHSRAPAALGRVGRIDEAGRALPSNDNTSLMPDREQLDALLRKNFVVNGGALLMRREAFEAAGAYDTTLAFGEDWEFWCRLCSLGDFGRVEGGPILLYRQRASGANHQAHGLDLRPGRSCLERISGNRVFRERYGRRLDWLLRARQIDMFWSKVRNEYLHGRQSKALYLAALGIATYPDSVLRPTLARRLLGSIRP
ncbi:putative glycosyltransferase [Rubellimicrobium mesophilum DSM 19309]|uniref:Putative glycosyltransferase n=1 Tax=Rubellimicrobium mesophilum DSM 19309 TaxID=442562 RepID=A0A017HKB4_9RHOB|nr:glycosyltransferase family A protein [Rubellimicrobium mesophilum]EYD74937.1 putative glycosyltransferase [Rubellimicrobium mesophilum DSM 19309]